jgi:PAS domain S-box-containing protein
MEITFNQGLSSSLRLDNASTTRRVRAHATKMYNVADTDRYNYVIQELATNAFKAYINSKMYKSWRAYESGSMQSLRGRLLSLITQFPHLRSENLIQHCSEVPGRGIDDLAYDMCLLDSSKSNEESANCGVASVCGPSSKSVLGTLPDFAFSTEDPDNPFTDCEDFDTTGRQMPSFSCGHTASYDRCVTPSTITISTNSSSHDSRSTPISLNTSGKSVVNGLSADARGTAVPSSKKVLTGRTPTKAQITTLSQTSAFPSFAESAFSVTSEDPHDSVLLLGSTWLAMLVAGVESVSIGFSLYSAPPVGVGSSIGKLGKVEHSHEPVTIVNLAKNMPVDDLKFVYANHQFERDFGYSKQELIGRSYKTLFCSGLRSQQLSIKEQELQKMMMSGVDSNMALPLRRKNGKFTRTFLCMKALYDQHNVFRYVICLSINVPPNCGIMYKNRCVDVSDYVGAAGVHGSTADRVVAADDLTRTAEQVDLIAQFNSDALVELLDSLPVTFVDDLEHPSQLF